MGMRHVSWMNMSWPSERISNDTQPWTSNSPELTPGANMLRQQAVKPASHIHEYMYKHIEHKDTYVNTWMIYVNTWVNIYVYIWLTLGANMPSSMQQYIHHTWKYMSKHIELKYTYVNKYMIYVNSWVNMYVYIWPTPGANMLSQHAAIPTSHVHTHMYTNILKNTHMQKRIAYKYIYIYIHIHIYTYICKWLSPGANMPSQHAAMPTSHLRICLYMYTYKDKLNIETYICIYINNWKLCFVYKYDLRQEQTCRTSMQQCQRARSHPRVTQWERPGMLLCWRVGPALPVCVCVCVRVCMNICIIDTSIHKRKCRASRYAPALPVCVCVCVCMRDYIYNRHKHTLTQQ